MRILITGGTGSLGWELVRVFLHEGHEVTVLSRDPHKQAKLISEYPKVRALLGDVRDYERVHTACKGQGIVIHAAALKRVELGETNPEEYFLVNVMGTRNVALAAATCNARKALLISTDKAPAASTLYGVTKKMAEGIWLDKRNCTTMFAAVRYGNVMNSNGGVWSIWQERAKANLPLMVREPEPTRFFMRKAEAVELVRNALLHISEQPRTVFVPGNTPAFSLWDLARQMQAEEQWLREPLGPGEKQHEVLVAPTEHVEQVEGDLWCIRPQRANSKQEVAAQFCSMTAYRLSGAEVVRRLSE